MTTAIETRVGALVNGLASCLCAELRTAEEESSVPFPCICTVMPGAEVAYDYCDEGGMAWTRLVAIDPVPSLGRCVTEWDVTVQVAVLRCAPQIDDEGNLPEDVEQLAASMLQSFDMGIMHKVLTCCPIPQSFQMQQMGSYSPIGPDGKCLGGSWTATYRTA